VDSPSPLAGFAGPPAAESVDTPRHWPVWWSPLPRPTDRDPCRLEIAARGLATDVDGLSISRSDQPNRPSVSNCYFFLLAQDCHRRSPVGGPHGNDNSNVLELLLRLAGFRCPQLAGFGCPLEACGRAVRLCDESNPPVSEMASTVMELHHQAAKGALTAQLSIRRP